MQTMLQLLVKWSGGEMAAAVVSSHRISFGDNEILLQHFNESGPAVRLCFLHNFMDRDSPVNGAQVVLLCVSQGILSLAF